ncbi:TonB-dependent receptor [Labilibacter marinus]|uniref:TonB-dependent receptor n=1 Tax=Labilibacter marinus TaxID=1477105 RepID=UPI00117BA6D5|nr:TonB-dependent receptor [Labilibacter marinus]
MKKLILFIFLSLVAVSTAWSQHTLSGTVVDDQKNLLIGANVIIEGLNKGTVTDADGKFTFYDVKSGEYNIKATYLGYNPISLLFKINEDTKITLQLNEKSFMKGEVIVSSIKAGNKTPVAKTNLTKEQLQSLNAADDIPLLLSLTPSVVSTTESGIGVGYSSMRIRGTDATRTNVTINGIPLNDPESQGVFWVNMPDFSSSVDEVQIQRGVGTSTNGGAAFGASINFNTTTFNAKPHAEISSTAGSFNTFKNSFSGSTGLIKDKFSFDFRYSDLQSDGYVDYAFSDHQSLYLSGTLHMNNSFLKANIIHGDQKTGISWWGIDADKLKEDRKYNPAGQYTDEFGNPRYYEDQTDNYKQTHYQIFYSHNLTNNWLLNTALHYTRGDGYYEQYKENESYKEYGWEPYEISPGEFVDQTDLIRQKWLTNDFYGFTSSLNYDNGDLSVNIGGGWNKYDGDHFGQVIWARFAGTSEKEDQWYFNNGVKTDYNIYAKVNYSLTSKLNVFGDLQHRGIKYTMEGIDDDLSKDEGIYILDQEHQFNFINPKAGVFYTVNKHHQIYSSFAVANREPTRTDFKDANGDSESTPRSERLNDLEIGYHYKSSKVAANINFYYMYYKDQLIPTGEKSNVGSPIMTNVDKSYRTGIELDLGVKILNNLSWSGNATFSKNIIKDYVETYDPDYNPATKNDIHIKHGDNQIAYSPSYIASSIFTYKAFKGNSISFITKHVGEQYFDNTQSEDRKLSAYTVSNAIFTQEFTPSWMKKIELQLSINNLFNKEYVSNAYGGNWYEGGVENSWAAYYPQAGTHAFFRARFIF